MAITDKNKSTIERLKELKSLYEAGILTEEEMKTEKEEILETNKNNTQQSSGSDIKSKDTNVSKMTILQDETTQHTDVSSSFFSSKKSIGIIALLVVIIIIALFVCIKSCRGQHTNDYISATDTTRTDTPTDTVFADSLFIKEVNESDNFDFDEIKENSENFEAYIQWPKSMTGIKDITKLQQCIIKKVFGMEKADIKYCVEQYFNECKKDDAKKAGIKVIFHKRLNIWYRFDITKYAIYNSDSGPDALLGVEHYLFYDEDLGRELRFNDFIKNTSAMLNLINNYFYVYEVDDLQYCDFIISSLGITITIPYREFEYRLLFSYDEINEILSNTFKKKLNNNIHTNYGWVKCTLFGVMSNYQGDNDIRLDFEKKGNEFRNCVYTNLEINGKIKMRGNIIDDNFVFTGKDGKHEFQIIVDKHTLEGDATDGPKKLSISLRAE